MCKRIIPFTLSFFFVVVGMAQDLRNIHIKNPNKTVASSRVPCAANQLGAVSSFGPIVGVNGGNGMSNSTPSANEPIFLCFDDQFSVLYDNTTVNIGGDPNTSTPSGVAYIAYTQDPNNPVLEDGPDLSTLLNADTALLGKPTSVEEIFFAADLLLNGNETFENKIYDNGETLQETFKNGEPLEIWFAPISVDAYDIANDSVIYEGNPAGPCVTVDLADAFSVVYLNPIEPNIVFPFPEGGDKNQARVQILGGLPEYDSTATYVIDVTNVDNSSIKGSVDRTNIIPGDATVISVDQPGTYQITISDGKSCSFSTTRNMDFEVSNIVPPVINIENPPGASIGQEICADITTEDFNGVIGSTFFLCWDTDFLEYSRIDNIDPKTLVGVTLTDQGNIIANFSSTDFTEGTTYADGTVLFTVCYTPTQAGNTLIEFCPSDPRNSTGKPDFVIAPLEELEFPIGPDNNGQNILITDPNALNVIFIDDEKKDACPGDSNGSFSIQVLGGLAPYQVVLIRPDGSNANIMINEQDGIGVIDQLVPGDYTYEVFDSGIVPDRRFSGLLGPITINEANLGADIATASQPTCFGGSDGSLIANISLNTVLITNLSNYTFKWITPDGDTIPNANQQIATNLSGGNGYQVFVEDSNGCKGSDIDGDLTQPGQMSITPSPIPASCSGVEDGMIGLNNPMGGITPFSYSWSDGNIGQNNVNIVSGEYFYTITDAGGCELIDTVNLIATNDFEIIPTMNGIKTPSCFGFADGFIDVTRDNSAPDANPNGWNYQWSSNATDIDNSVNILSRANNLAGGTYSVTLTNDALPLGCQDTLSFNLMQPDSLIIDNVMITNVSSCSLTNPDGGIEVTPMGGTPLPTGDYLYEWDTMGVPIAFTSAITGQDAGRLTLTVTDDNNCVAILDTLIGTPPPPVIAAIPTVDLNCANDNTDLMVSATSGRPGVNVAQYLWSHDNSLTTANASNVGPGTYYITVVDTDGCASLDSAIVTSPEPVRADSITFTEPCFQTPEGIISIFTTTGGIPTYSYEWKAEGDPTTINSSAALTNVESGNYVLSIIDGNSCVFDTTITLNNIPRIDVAFNLATVTGVDCFDTVNPADCNGFAEANAAYEGTGGGAFTFSWDATTESSGNTATSFFSNSLCAGMQALRVTDGQCTVVDSIMIPSPNQIELVVDNLVEVRCFGEANGAATISAIGGVGGKTFTWPDGGNETAKTDLAANMYEITITDANSCIATSMLEIPQPQAALSVSIDPNPINTHGVVCQGDVDGLITVIVDGGNQGALNYNWTNNVSNINTAAGLSPGTYVIEVTDAKSCMATTTYDVLEPQPITANIEWDPIQCNGFQTGIRISNPTGGNGADYSFSVENSPARPSDETITDFGGPKLISLFDATGCREDMMITIPEPRALEVSFADNLTQTEVDLGSNITLNLEIGGDVPVSDIFWTVDGGAIDTTFLCSFNPCSNPTVNPLDNTTYTAFVTDANGCMSEASILVEVDKNRNVYIPNVFAPNNSGFDTNDRFEVFTGSGVSKINYAKVFNRWGTMVADVSQRIINGIGETIQVWDGQIKGQNANQGVYIYIIEIEFIDGTKLLYRGDVALLR